MDVESSDEVEILSPPTQAVISNYMIQNIVSIIDSAHSSIQQEQGSPAYVLTLLLPVQN
jgi:hypothetical protein